MAAQHVSKQHGKKRHVSKNTVTKSDLYLFVDKQNKHVRKARYFK